MTSATRPLTMLAGRLAVPTGTAALLWDMDGVLLDTVQLDLDCADRLVRAYAPGAPAVDAALVRRLFAYDPVEFWHRMLAELGVELPAGRAAALVEEYERIRRTATAPVHRGVVEILAAAPRNAVVSNNPERDVRSMLANAGLLDRFELVVGNDRPGLAKKPAPDPYLEACARLGLDPADCVVVEDSLLGAAAGHAAGCFTVGVATGGCDLDELRRSPSVSASYPDFAAALERTAGRPPAGGLR